jgi:hypothetical protein
MNLKATYSLPTKSCTDDRRILPHPIHNCFPGKSIEVFPRQFQSTQFPTTEEQLSGILPFSNVAALKPHESSASSEHSPAKAVEFPGQTNRPKGFAAAESQIPD